LAYPNQPGFPPAGPPPVYVSAPSTNGMATAALTLAVIGVAGLLVALGAQ